jgi:hypothetical protein
LTLHTVEGPLFSNPISTAKQKEFYLKEEKKKLF